MVAVHDESNLSSTHFIYFTLYDEKTEPPHEWNRVSNSVQITYVTGTNSSITIPYTVYKPAGSIIYIHANTGYYAAKAVGYWYS